MTEDEHSEARPYHHGDLRRALVAAAVDLARAGGPDAIMLREVTRRVGVSATAAYRHFTALPDLLDEVARECRGDLSEAMRAEVARCEPTGDAYADAWDRLRAIGRGYVHFALDQPGLFATAFSDGRKEVGSDLAIRHGDTGPRALLEDALDGMVAVGAIDPADRAAAATVAWSAVHGLSNLLLGPLGAVPAKYRDAAIESTVDLIGRGILRRDRPIGSGGG